MVDNYLKIEFLEETLGADTIEYFVITRKDGTQLRYDSLGKLAGDAVPSNGTQRNLLFKRKWLLSSVTDTQTNSNSVTFSYAFSPLTEGRAHRPASISYSSGYTIDFHYETLSTPLATYGTGALGYMGKQTSRLSAVTIKDGIAQIRAYNLSYATSQQTGTSLLSEVSEYGSDYVLSGHEITAGSQLPSPLSSAAYSSDTTTFASTTYTGKPIHRGNIVIDSDRDGDMEVIMYRIRQSDIEIEDGSDYNGYTLPAGNLQTNYARQFISQSPHSALANTGVADYRHHDYFLVNGFAGYAPSQDRDFFFLDRIDRYEKNDEIRTRYQIYGYEFNGATQSWLSIKHVNSGPNERVIRYGNFDDDPDPEVLAPALGSGGFFEIYAGGLSPRPVSNSQIGLHWIADFDGDGQSEILETHQQFFPNTWRLADPRHTSFSITGTPLRFSSTYPTAATGDFNGDGLVDILSFVRSESGPGPYTNIKVATSSGAGFEASTTWANTSGFPVLSGNWASSDHRYGLGEITVGDINGDGLDDVIAHEGHDTVNVDGWRVVPAYGSRSAHIFLSNGTKFVQVSDTGSRSIPDFAGLGDIDGDGLLDGLAEGANGRVFFNTGVVPNLLTSFINANGGTTTVEYTSSNNPAHASNNEGPTKHQVVAAIEASNGRGDTRRTEFSYTGNAFDYNYRRSLGFTTVAAEMDAVAGEIAGPTIVTTYLNDHVGESGHIKSQIVSTDGTTTWRRTINEYAVDNTGRGPFRAQRTSTRTAERYGTALVETMREMSTDLYGETEWVRDMGFTIDGVDQATTDNSYVEFEYARNLSDYIVNRPSAKKTYAGSTSTSNRADWLEQAFYSYDELAHGVAPTRGNLTETEHWNGDLGGGGVQTRFEIGFSYDAYGNVTAEEDARSNSSTFAYDTQKNLFRTSETNAVSHVIGTTWNYGCQAPVTITDANGLVTTFTYDAFCRETNRSLPSGQYEATAYLNLGTPTTQHIQRSSLSGSSVPGSTISIAREYFDGFGETYKTSVSGDTSSSADDIVTLREFDNRGRLAWESIPLTPTQASGTPSSSQRTELAYDPYGRLLETVHPDGAKRTQAYTVKSTTRYGQSIDVPTVHAQDENCHDGVSFSMCGEIWRLTDSRGNVIREDRYDTDLTDVNEVDRWRETSFTYDLRNRLIGVTDPLGATWTYVYDVFGNRTSADDPGLGYWTMDYDNNGNLVLQTDAKNQTIAFEYDAINRPTKKTVTGGPVSPVVTEMTYDQTGFGGDNVGQLTTVAVPGHTITYEYGDTGQVETETHTIGGSSGGSGGTVVAPVTTYDPVMDRGTFSISPDGTQLTVDDDGFKAAAHNFTVTANTVLEFDFEGYVNEGQSHAIGVDNDATASPTHIFKLFGYEAYGIPDFDNYWGGKGLVSISIPLGQYFTGSFDRISFITKDFWQTGSSSTFSNVRIGEPGNMTDIHFTTGGGGGGGTGVSYTLEYNYHASGALLDQRLPDTPGATSTSWTGTFEYDAAGRPTSFGSHISSIDYDLRSNPTQMDYGNGVVETITYDAERGWPDRFQVTDAWYVWQSWSDYTRHANGQVDWVDTEKAEGNYSYAYDYSGRLLSATNNSGQPLFDQAFTYNAAGSMASNSHVGDYTYLSSAPDHAPAEIDQAGTITALTYDANGNMLTGLGGKTMTYDGENRPLSVTLGGSETQYEYGAAGSRLKKIENAGTANETVTAYFGPVEIRNFGEGTSEEVFAYPHTNVRLTNGAANYLHRDQLASVKHITNATGFSAAQNSYKPFGEVTVVNTDPAVKDETIGYIGERLDGDAGLHFLNARYYDPELGIFVQPDWWDVDESQVGTNRFAYAANDPVNRFDSNGNAYEWAIFGNSPYTLLNGIQTHVALDQLGVTSSFEGYEAEVSIFNQAGARKGGLFDTGEFEAAFNGVPDATRRTGSNTAEFFDYKPYSRKSNPDLYRADLRQQKRWIEAAKRRGVTLTPADMSELIPEHGLETGILIPGSEGPTYEVILHRSDIDGIVLYELRDTGRTRHNGERLGRAVGTAINAVLNAFLGCPRCDEPKRSAN